MHMYTVGSAALPTMYRGELGVIKDRNYEGLNVIRIIAESSPSNLYKCRSSLTLITPLEQVLGLHPAVMLVFYPL